MGMWNWLDVHIFGGVECLLLIAYRYLDSLSILEIVYLFRNIYFGLSGEDSYDCCRNCMRNRWIETNLLSIVIEYGCVFNTLYMYDVWEEKGDVLHIWEKKCNGLHWIKLACVSRVKVSKTTRIDIGTNSLRRNFCNMANWSVCVMIVLVIKPLSSSLN